TSGLGDAANPVRAMVIEFPGAPDRGPDALNVALEALVTLAGVVYVAAKGSVWAVGVPSPKVPSSMRKTPICSLAGGAGLGSVPPGLLAQKLINRVVPYGNTRPLGYCELKELAEVPSV